jgi:DNA-binding transcriptional MerR regulator
MATYRTKDIIEIIPNVSQNQLIHWAEKGIVPPSHRDADGHGSWRLYTFRDLVKIDLVRRFLSFGMSLKIIGTHLDWMENKPDPDMFDMPSGITGADGKGYKDIWDGLTKNRKAFRYYCEMRDLNTGFIKYEFAEAVFQEEVHVEYALFVNIGDMVERLENWTEDTL